MPVSRISLVVAASLLLALAVPGQAASAAPATVLLDGFEGAASEWTTTAGEALVTSSPTSTEGGHSFSLEYDVSSGSAETGRLTAELPEFGAPASGLTVDLRGDGSYNTVYLRLRDATGELFVHRVDAMRSTDWMEVAIDLTAPPTASGGGNGDGVLDAPFSLSSVAVVRNGSQPATGTLLLDNLRAAPTGWTLPASDTDYFSPAGSQTATLGFTPGAPGDYSLVLTDVDGQVRTIEGTAATTAPVSTVWNGLADDGTPMRGAVHGVLRTDSSADGSLAATAVATGIPLLVTVAEADPAATTLLDGFDDAAPAWTVAGGAASLTTSTTAKSSGTSSLGVTYDVGGSMVVLHPSVATTVATRPVSSLRLDVFGDGSANQLFVSVLDATGELLYYPAGTLARASWSTATVDLAAAPEYHSGGDLDGVPDLPLQLDSLTVLGADGGRPAGSLRVDNLRVVSTGWTLPAIDVEQFTASDEDDASTVAFEAGSAGPWSLVLSDAAGRTRTLSGTADDAGPVTVDWNGETEAGVALRGDVGGVFSQGDDSTAVLSRSGIPLLVTVLAADDPATTTLAEGFNTGAAGWATTGGTAALAGSTTSNTEGVNALRIDYDLTLSMAEVDRTTPPTIIGKATSALKLDLKGDASYNTLYVMLLDATGESFYYRVDALRQKTWTTATVDLTEAPALAGGGNDNLVLDLPAKLGGFAIVRNGAQPATGSVVLDDLRVVSHNWTIPTASTAYFDANVDPTVRLSFAAGTPGDYSLTLVDVDGREKLFSDTRTAAGPVTIDWDGRAGDGSTMRGEVSAVLRQDSTPDGFFEAGNTESGVALLLTLAEVNADALLVDGFESAADWRPGTGTVTATTVAERTEGSAAVALSYDVTTSDAELERTVTPTPFATTPISALMLDMRGDGSYNTVFLKLRDATGELFLYRADALRSTRWATTTIDLTQPPASSLLGNADGVLDYPVSLVRINVVRNGAAAPATGIVVLDNLRVVDEDWSALESSERRFSRENAGSTTLGFTVGRAGDWEVQLKDLAGRARTFSGTADEPGPVSESWDGSDDDGVAMAGSVAGLLRYDTSPDGSLDSTPVVAAFPWFTGVTARVTPEVPTSITGINSFLTQQDDPVEADRQAALLEDAYVRFAREEFEWKQIEPRQGSFEWAKFDQAVEIAAARNVDFIGKLAYTAPWASSAPAGTAQEDVEFYPPTNLSDYTDYVREVVHRYKDRVHVWEVWNEPNTTFYWKPAPDAAAYAEMLKAAYAVIKAEDPTATVITAGLDQFDEGFMQGVLAAGAGDSFDGLTIHLYTHMGAPETSTMPTYLDAAASFIERSAPGKSLWITEVSWATCTTCDGATSEADQADYLERFYLDAAKRGYKGVAWYNLVGGGDDDHYLDTYAVTTLDGRLKPSYYALKDVGAALYQATATGATPVSADAAPVVVDGLETVAGHSVWTVGGGVASLAPLATGQDGGAALSVDYDFTGSSLGAQISTSIPLPGEPTAVSVWVKGDTTMSPVYLKIMDATGETFQGLVANAGVSDWTKATLFSDGLNGNYAHAGGDGDGVWDYPVRLTDVFVYRSQAEYVVGSIGLDDLTAEYGPNLHGAVLDSPEGTIQGVYAAKPTTASVVVPGASAKLKTAAALTPLPVLGGAASLELGTGAQYVVSP